MIYSVYQKIISTD
nr:unnamed protein product [Callosobruchus chinensis]